LLKRKVKLKEIFWCGISESDIENQADIRNTGASEVFKNGYKVQQLVIVRVRKPAADGNSVLRMEYV
jgi:hypothetical protein